VSDFNGAALKDLRTKSGVSQSELAEYMGYFTKGKPNRSMISQLESKSEALNLRVQRVAEAYFAERGISRAIR